MGGALATLAAHRVHDRVASLYTYGQPLVGNRRFVKSINSICKGHYYRIINDKDVFSRVPPHPLYRHSGIVKFLDASGQLIDQSMFDGDFDPCRPLSIKEYKLLFSRIRHRKEDATVEAPDEDLQLFTDHHIDRYINKLQALL